MDTTSVTVFLSSKMVFDSIQGSDMLFSAIMETILERDIL